MHYQMFVDFDDCNIDSAEALEAKMRTLFDRLEPKFGPTRRKVTAKRKPGRPRTLEGPIAFQFLRGNSPASIRETAEATGQSRPNTWRALEKGIAQGRIRKEEPEQGPTQYSYISDGKQYDWGANI